MRMRSANWLKQIISLFLTGIILISLPIMQGCGIAVASEDPKIDVLTDAEDNADQAEKESTLTESKGTNESEESPDGDNETTAEEAENTFPAELSMYYDDHLDMSGKEIEIIDAGTPDSFQVGYGIEEGTPDEAVLRLDGETLVAVGTGSGKITVDGQKCSVTVTAAPISLFLLIGQSNMEGMEGEPTQSISCPNGQVYASYGEYNKLNRYTAKYYAASALTGEGSKINVLGTPEYLSDFPINSLTESGNGKKGMDSGIAYEWNRITGEKVWVVNAAHNGAVIQTYQQFNENYVEAVTLFSSCEETLKKEITAGHYVLSHMGVFWCQGCSDQKQPADAYTLKFQAMYNAMKTELSMDMDNNPDTPDDTLEFANIILVLAGGGTSRERGYRGGMYQDENSGFYGTFKEMEMRGPRVAQLWMGANPDLPEIHVVCNLGDQWMMMPDGTDNVEEYFASHYENGRVDYPTQEPQPEDWYSPQNTLAVKDSAHYNQIGYNEVGIETARNTCILLGYQENTDEPTTVTFVDWTGYETVSTIEPFTWGQVGTLVVPVVSPVYSAKEVSYEVTEGLKYEYYDLTTANYNIKEGTLSVAGSEDGPEVKIMEKEQ